MKWLALSFVTACATLTPAPPVRVADQGPERRAREEAAPLPFLVDDEGSVLGTMDGASTLFTLEGRCVGEVRGERFVGCELGRVRVALPGDALGTLLRPQASEAPALAVDAPLRGGFAGHSLRYEIDSPPGDALCPGSPTRIRFFTEHASLGEVSLDAPIARQLGQGVAALLVTSEDAYVVLNWGRDSWRVVGVRGETLSEGRYGPDETCDCCE